VCCWLRPLDGRRLGDAAKANPLFVVVLRSRLHVPGSKGGRVEAYYVIYLDAIITLLHECDLKLYQMAQSMYFMAVFFLECFIHIIHIYSVSTDVIDLSCLNNLKSKTFILLFEDFISFGPDTRVQV
jgi:hypothetical protein